MLMHSVDWPRIDTRYRFAIVSLIALTSIVVAACGADARDASSPTVAASDANPIDVVTTTTIFADFVQQVGGDRVAVQSLVPTSADIHTFTISPSDIRAVSAADLVIVGGAGLEASFEDAVTDHVNGAVVVLTDGLGLSELRPQFRSDGGDSPSARAVDPHFWLDVTMTIRAVESIRAALVAVDETGAPQYDANTARYIGELERLDREIADALGALPPERRVLVTFHDAFGYFAARYDLEILGFLVEGPEEEPNAGDVADLIEAIESRGVPLIFTEPQFESSIVNRVASEAGADVAVLYSGFLNEERPTYIELMRGNARALTN
jgi:ABC-type Zn uptake system ZnuABC Zn-binding protein ZnuA